MAKVLYNGNCRNILGYSWGSKEWRLEANFLYKYFWAQILK